MRYSKLASLMLVVLVGCAQSDQLSAAPPTESQEELSITSKRATIEDVDGTFTITMHDVSPKAFTFVNGDLQAPNEVIPVESVIADWTSMIGSNNARAKLVTSQPSIGSFEQVAALEMGKPSYSAANSELTFSAILSEGEPEPELEFVSVYIELPAAP